MNREASRPPAPGATIDGPIPGNTGVGSAPGGHSRVQAAVRASSARAARVGASYSPSCSWPSSGAAAVCVPFTVAAPTVVLAGFAGLAAGHLAMRAAYERKLGGYTGDCLGAVQQTSELGMYLGVVAAT